MSTAEDILFGDLPLTKKLTTGGRLIEITNSDALAQAIKLWINCGKGEKIRASSGGWGIWALGKELSESNTSFLKKHLVEGLNTDFSPAFTTTKCEVVADTSHNRWLVNIQGYCPGLNIGINTISTISNS